MKCDELEEEYLWTNNVKTPSTIMVRAYNADDVDKVIAELKKRIQLDDDEMAGFLQLEEECGCGDLSNYIAELKAELESAQASMYADVVDASMENRRLRMALCLLRFAFSKLEQNYISRFEYNESKWDEMWEKRADYWKAKAEEYK